MSLKVAITGSSGMVGSVLLKDFKEKGYQVTRILRDSSDQFSDDKSAVWNIEDQTIEAEKLEGQDAVIHLAGANVAGQRWTPAYKKLIEESRSAGTSLLSQTLAKLNHPPKILISASAVGFYGNDTIDHPKTETSPRGEGFLADVCQKWEDATRPAKDKGIRVVNLRIATVLGASGGALAKMLPIFKLGLGGKVASGSQAMSWIAVDEFPGLIDFLINRSDLEGPVNGASPNVVTNSEFTRILGEVIRRPVIFPVPAFGVRLLFGEMGQKLLIEGMHVIPEKLHSAGYEFRFPDLKGALQKILTG